VLYVDCALCHILMRHVYRVIHQHVLFRLMHLPVLQPDLLLTVFTPEGLRLIKRLVRFALLRIWVKAVWMVNHVVRNFD
jgi:hypothetical protein